MARLTCSLLVLSFTLFGLASCGPVDADEDGFIDCDRQYWPTASWLKRCGEGSREPAPDTASCENCELLRTRWDPAVHDCNDGDPARHPGAEEICNAFDDNCDGFENEGLDCDQDGFVHEDDCDDGDSAVSPAVPENCTDPFDKDNDCDGLHDSEDPDCTL